MFYSDLRKTIKVGTVRKISHSFFTYVRSLRKGSASAKVGAATNFATNTLGAATTGTAAFTLIVGTTVAEAAAGAALIAAISGPWAGITVGLIAIVFLAKSAYSSRESAHEALFNYCWNIVDSEPPTAKFNTLEDLGKIAPAAMKLLEEGGKQLEDQGRKYQLASDNFITFHARATRKISELTDTHALYMQSFQAVAYAVPAGAANASLLQNTMTVNQQKFNKLKTEIENEFKTASEVNGEIFEMVRRCQHYSEYIQAPLILTLHYQCILAGSITKANEFSTVDFFKDIDKVTALRTKFRELGEAYSAVGGLVI